MSTDGNMENASDVARKAGGRVRKGFEYAE
jgi:hypothetical protein